MVGQYTIPATEFRRMILRSYYLNPYGMSDKGFSYIPITRETFEKLKNDPAFREGEIKNLESRIIN
jgi:hypothetical protein